jgi:hypothetical protein
MPAYNAGKVEPMKEFFVPAGRYRLKVVEAKDDTDEKARDITDVTFRAILKDGSDGPKFKQRFWFTEKALFRFDQFLISCGQYPGEGQRFDVPAEEMVGWECEADLKVRTYKTKEGDKRTTNEVDRFVFDDFA